MVVLKMMIAVRSDIFLPRHQPGSQVQARERESEFIGGCEGVATWIGLLALAGLRSAAESLQPSKRVRQ